MVIIKWSKTFQDRCKTTSIAKLGNSALVAALIFMVSKYPASENSPLFQVPSQLNLVPLTDSVARTHLKTICTVLSLNKSLTFHDFRRAWGLLGLSAWRSLAGHLSLGHMVFAVHLEISPTSYFRGFRGSCLFSCPSRLLVLLFYWVFGCLVGLYAICI